MVVISFNFYFIWDNNDWEEYSYSKKTIFYISALSQSENIIKLSKTDIWLHIYTLLISLPIHNGGIQRGGELG